MLLKCISFTYVIEITSQESYSRLKGISKRTCNSLFYHCKFI